VAWPTGLTAPPWLDRRKEIDVDDWREACEGLPLEHMGRGPDDDPGFFASAFAAGRLARLARRTGLASFGTAAVLLGAHDAGIAALHHQEEAVNAQARQSHLADLAGRLGAEYERLGQQGRDRYTAAGSGVIAATQRRLTNLDARTQQQSARTCGPRRASSTA